MLKNIGLFILGLIVALVTGGYFYLKDLPQTIYQKALRGEKNRFFYLDPMNPQWLSPGKILELPQKREQLEDLWQKFHIKDMYCPLPVRHPSFTLNLLLPTNDQGQGSIGLALRSSGGRLSNKIFFLDEVILSPGLDEHEVFKLPLSQLIIERIDEKKLWEDLFLLDLKQPVNKVDKMIYNLYLLKLRSLFFPPDVESYGLFDDRSKAIFQLVPQNKDYKYEIIFTYQRGLIYALGLMTELNNPDAELARSKFVHECTFRESDESFTPMIYREFKSISYSRQIDEEGLLYLLSAWSHQLKNGELVKEMVYNLERGQNNQNNLKALYEYSFKNFKTTFSTRDVGVTDLKGEVKLQLQIDWENQPTHQTSLDNNVDKEVEISPKDKINMYLEKVKTSPAPKSKKLKFD